ncbi:cytosolic sulfotransferase 3-like [Paramisgurnus dabryanus]|uniref:cytosolic sulfotransferase 3-like n=1 Tax=Paramisgurnus dabryanus TaxID=90735 RepID=UPI0031F36318
MGEPATSDELDDFGEALRHPNGSSILAAIGRVSPAGGRMGNLIKLCKEAFVVSDGSSILTAIGRVYVIYFVPIYCPCVCCSVLVRLVSFLVVSCRFLYHIWTELADNLKTSPRLIKTHLPVQLVPKSFWEQNSKVVYVARNAKDNAVSYFHFDRMNKGEPEPGDWNNFLQKFMEGKKVFGPWYDHVSRWWEKKQTYSNLLYLFYEDLVEDTGREVERLCSFLGLATSADEREKITKGVHFDAMKNNKMTNYSTIPVMDFKISPFMRKGKVGDWKTHFTVAQNEEFDEVYKQKMKNTTVKFRTEL